MSFVRAECWEVAQSQARDGRSPSFADQRWTGTAAALTLTAGIEAALIAALFFLGNISRPAVPPHDHGITLVDMASPTAQPVGAARTTAQKPPTASAHITQVDATLSPPLPREWSITTLPLTPATPNEATSPPAFAAPAQGLASAGTGSGAGYDPYAFASYRAPSSAGPAAPAVAPVVQARPDAMAQLEVLLHRRLGSALKVDARLVIDRAGRVVSASILSSFSPSVVATISDAVTGFPLCDPDMSRVSNAEIMVTLTA